MVCCWPFSNHPIWGPPVIGRQRRLIQYMFSGTFTLRDYHLCPKTKIMPCPGDKGSKKVKFSLLTPWAHIRRLRVYLHSFLNSQLDTGERLTSRLCWSTPGEEPRYPFSRRLSGLQSRSEQWFKSSWIVKCEKKWRFGNNQRVTSANWTEYLCRLLDGPSG